MKNIINKYLSSRSINYLRLAGFKYLTVIDVLKDRAKIYLLRKIKRSTCYETEKAKYEIFHRINLDSSNPVEINKTITGFLKSRKIKEIPAIIGFNDFKLVTITSTEELDDEKDWINEKIEKILPQNSSNDEFEISYTKYNQDEDHQYYAVVIARKNLIDKLQEIRSDSLIYKLSVLPILTSPLLSNEDPNNINSLFFNLGYPKLQCLYFTEDRNIGLDEIYFEDFELSQESDKIWEKLNEWVDPIFAKFDNKKAIPQIVITSDDNIDESAPNKLLELLHKRFKGIIQPRIVKNYFVLRVVQNYILAPSNGFNFLSKDESESVIEKLTKKIGIRFLLVNFTVILGLMLLLTISDKIVSAYLNNANENLIEVSDKLLEFENLKLENENLKNNFRLYSSLSKDLPLQSYILKTISDFIPPGTRVVNISINYEGKSLSIIRLEGLSRSQDEIGEFLRQLESKDNFSDVKLSLITASQKELKIKYNIKDGDDKYYFNLEFNYESI